MSLDKTSDSSFNGDQLAAMFAGVELRQVFDTIVDHEIDRATCNGPEMRGDFISELQQIGVFRYVEFEGINYEIILTPDYDDSDESELDNRADLAEPYNTLNMFYRGMIRVRDIEGSTCADNEIWELGNSAEDFEGFTIVIKEDLEARGRALSHDERANYVSQLIENANQAEKAGDTDAARTMRDQAKHMSDEPEIIAHYYEGLGNHYILAKLAVTEITKLLVEAEIWGSNDPTELE